MRSLRPQSRCLNFFPSTTSRNLCPACYRAALRSTHPNPIRSFTSNPTQRAADSTPFTEKLRRKIWGTDSPPGQADPYSKESLLDRTNKPEQPPPEEGPRTPEVPTKPAIASVTAQDPNYKPATTWEGLEEVGDYEEFWEQEWLREHPFNGYVRDNRGVRYKESRSPR